MYQVLKNLWSNWMRSTYSIIYTESIQFSGDSSKSGQVLGPSEPWGNTTCAPFPSFWQEYNRNYLLYKASWLPLTFFTFLRPFSYFIKFSVQYFEPLVWHLPIRNMKQTSAWNPSTIAVHTVSFDQFLSGLEWIIYLEFCYFCYSTSKEYQI